MKDYKFLNQDATFNISQKVIQNNYLKNIKERRKPIEFKPIDIQKNND